MTHENVSQEETVSETSKRFMKFVAERTKAPEAIAAGQEGSALFGISEGDFWPANTVNLAFYDHDESGSEPGSVERTSRISLRLVTDAIEGSDYTADPRYGEDVTTIRHRLGGKTPNGAFYVSVGETESGRVRDESFAVELLDKLEANEAAGRITPLVPASPEAPAA